MLQEFGESKQNPGAPFSVYVYLGGMGEAFKGWGRGGLGIVLKNRNDGIEDVGISFIMNQQFSIINYSSFDINE